MQADVLLPWVVVDEPDRRVAERGRPQHLLDDQLRGVARAHHHRLLAARDDPAGQRPLDQRPREHAHTGDEGETQEQIDEPDAARNADAMDREDREDEVDDKRAEPDTAQRTPHVARRDVSPPAVVEAGEDEDGELDRHHEQDDRRVEVAVVVARSRLVEAKVPGEPPRQRDDPRIDRNVPEPMPVQQPHHATTPAAASTVSTTRSCCSGRIPAQSGTEKFSAAARSVSGRSPSV